MNGFNEENWTQIDDATFQQVLDNSNYTRENLHDVSLYVERVFNRKAVACETTDGRKWIPKQ